MRCTQAEQLCAQSGSPARGTKAEVAHWDAVGSTSLATHVLGGQDFPLCMFGDLLGWVNGTSVITAKYMAWSYSLGTVTNHRSQHMRPQSLPL